MSRRGRKEDNFDRVAEIARSAYRTAEHIKDLINVESKRVLVAQTSTSVTSSGTILATIQTAIAQGDDYNQRIGDSIKCHTLTLRWCGELNAVCNFGRIRLIVFWDEANVITSVGQLLESTGSIQGILSGKTFDNRFLSKILYDKVMTHERSIGAGTTPSPMPYHEAVIKLGKHTQFDISTTTVVTGALKLLAISDQGAANQTYISFNANLSYTDD